MNFQGFTFGIVLIAFLICKESQSDPIIFTNPNVKKEQINEGFVKLLSSLVRVNEDRLDALKKFIKLNDFLPKKPILRNSGFNGEGPEIAIFLINQDDASQITNQLSLLRDKKMPPYSESESDSSFSDDSDDRADTLSDILLLRNLGSAENSPEVVSTENRRPSNDSDVLVSDSDSGERKFKNGPSGRLLCPGPSWSRYYEHCKRACKDSYIYACSYYGCSSSLYNRLRKECSYTCNRRIQ